MTWTALADLLVCRRDGVCYARDPALAHEAFVRQVVSVAGALRARGVRHAALWFEDAAQLAVALFACWRAGAVAVLAADARAGSCAAIDPDADVWLTDDARLPVAPARRLSLADLDGAAAPLDACRLDASQGGIVLWTSGSSGRPKRIRKRWAQLDAEIRALEACWRWADAPACVLGSVSGQHMYGLPFRVLWPLAAGRTIERVQLAFPESLQHASLAHPAFVWIASPALLKRLGDHLSWDALAGGIRQIFSAGGPLPASVSDLLARRLGCRPIEIYGSSETGAVAWREGGAAWQPLPGVQTGIQEGALWVRSPWLDTEEKWVTADAATPDASAGSRFRLHGRLDRIVKIEEKRLALPALEQRLAGHPHVREARLGIADTPRLTALVALTQSGIHALRNGGRKALIESLRTHMAAAVEPLGVPRHWRLMRELPWNTQGKLPHDDFLAAARRPRAPVVREAHTSASPDGAFVAQLRLEVPLDLTHFNGHFPDTPVVPGVVQVDWAMALARRHIEAPPAIGFHGMEALKFQQLLRPGDVVDLTLTRHHGRAKLYFEYRLGGRPCSSGRILTAPQEDAPRGPGVPTLPATS
ncbi:AMP-binding protein [Bordetella genomosp. 9]|uniref:Uncharacterized protein n=1 Tax=Bordetella genomosp. 9 TaxID=1416803 RepID=A0A1W6Z147_9BORD|nr:AMP-binding protein [Bordetella genomosp. 9]ARP87060.1 hypothetical protein CAL13_13205 [Bordetella genomosp. 9]